MINKDTFRDKIRLLDINQDIFLKSDIRRIRETRKDFSRSLLLLTDLEEINLSAFNEIEKLVILFKEIVGLELLVRFNERGSIHNQFSNRITLLLATRIEQLEIIRNHLEALYILRNDIAHTFSLKKREEFEIYFSNDIDEAIHYANAYHRMLLLRMFFREKEVIDKNIFSIKLKKYDNLSSIKIGKKLEVPPPEYSFLISKELYSITGVKSITSKEAFIFKLPEESEKFFLGLNSHGGLISPVHETINKSFFFYEDKEYFTGESRIIPSVEIWNDFITEIRKKLKEIYILTPASLKIVSKTHKSVLFFVGYYFSKTKMIKLISDIDGKEMELVPSKDDVIFEKYWDVSNNNLKNPASEVVLILNTTGYINQIVEMELERLNLQGIPKIVCNLKLNNSNLSPTDQNLYNSNYIKKACRSLELFLNNSVHTRSLRRIHLFIKTRGVFAIMLGMHLGTLGYKVLHYEFGRENRQQEDEHYYHVFSSYR